MHKTLYIDIDEEITSIIDRVKKAEAKEVIIIAPKNALILQGIVNLKLLKKETDRQKKQLLIITQDKFGKKMIEKAGISAQTKAENDLYLEEDTEEEIYEPNHKKEASEIKKELEKEELVGSAEYFNENVSKNTIFFGKQNKKTLSLEDEAPPPEAKNKARKIIKSKEIVNMSDIVVTEKPKIRKKKEKNNPEKEISQPKIIAEEAKLYPSYNEISAEPPKISQISIKKADQFFRIRKRNKKEFGGKKVSGGLKKAFFFFVLVIFFLSALIISFFFLPKADLNISIRSKEKPVSLDLNADIKTDSTSANDRKIPVIFIEKEEDYSEEFSATGTKQGGSKASGKVVIYNEFSSEDQPLVITTRLETEDGKIFRIKKNVVVPGVAKVGGESKPGAVEVEVESDQVGDSYNIDPSDFRITGFKNSPDKFNKFYAKSSEKMSGGSIGEGKVITAQDIIQAEEKIAADSKKNGPDNIRKNIPDDQKIPDNQIQVEILGISVSENAGAEKEKFKATAKLRLSAVSFLEKDIKNIIINNLVQSGENSEEIDLGQPLNYVFSKVDSEQKIIQMQVKTNVKIAAKMDLANFKKGILGKTENEAQEYAESFGGIEKMNITFWPFFVKRLPMNEKRVYIEFQ